MKLTSLALSVSAALIASPLFAQENIQQNNQEQDIEKMVVVSSRVAMPLREIATSVSVVTKEDIELRGYSNLADVLKVQASIGVTNTGGEGTTSALRIRGEEGYRTLVRVDGVDISDPTGTQVGPQLAHLQSSNIQRVEILRGSQGLAYGADAGGVINILSGAGSEDLSGNISGELGRYGTTNLAADVGGSIESLDYYLSASNYQTDGFNSRIDDTSLDQDGYENTTIHSRLGWQVNEELKFGVVLRNTSGDGEYDNCFSALGTNDCENEFTQSNLRVTANYETDNSGHELAYAKTIVERENFTDGISAFFTKGNVERFEYLGNTDFTEDHGVVYGLDWEKEVISSSDLSRISKGYYLEYQGQFIENLYVTAGVRHDDNEDFGEHTSVRLSGAYIWAVGNDELTLRSAYGTGFRAPSLSEIDYNNSAWAYAPATDSDLKEENTKGYEVAIEYNLQNGSHFEAVYFDQKITDSIEFDLANFSGYIQEIGDVYSEGLELIANLTLSESLRFSGNYSYNDTEDTTGEQRIRRPKHLVNIGLDYQIEKLTVSANVRLVKDFTDSVYDSAIFQSVRVPMDDYQIVDLSARYSVTPKLTVFARVENLFGEDYKDLAEYNTKGQAPYVGVQYQF
ncbi:MAG: TonB-dependent receptor [Paraglaciecola sp.]|uniref:TonB-dependent receptor plug domain-containing protein n=2 Tax=Paraglaciecola sp. TaxID=1920173 RepID=UPI0032973DE8